MAWCRVMNRGFQDIEEAVEHYFDEWEPGQDWSEFLKQYLDCCDLQLPEFDVDEIVERISERHYDEENRSNEFVSTAQREALQELVKNWIAGIGWGLYTPNGKSYRPARRS